MKNRAWLFQTLLVTLLLFAQHGAIAHALNHAAEADKSTVHAELCAQCLDFAQISAGPLSFDLPQIPAPSGEGALQVFPALHVVFSNSPAFNFQSRAPPFSFT